MLLLVPKFIEIISFAYSNKVNLLNLFHNKCIKQSWDKLVIVGKGLPKLPSLTVLIKQNTLWLSINLAPANFGTFLMVILAKVNLLYLLYLMILSCCLMHSIQHSYLLESFLKTRILMTQVRLSDNSQDSLRWGSLTMVPAGNKAKCLSSGNHNTKTIHHQVSLYLISLLDLISSCTIFL